MNVCDLGSRHWRGLPQPPYPSAVNLDTLPPYGDWSFKDGRSLSETVPGLVMAVLSENIGVKISVPELFYANPVGMENRILIIEKGGTS